MRRRTLWGLGFLTALGLAAVPIAGAQEGDQREQGETNRKVEATPDRAQAPTAADRDRDVLNGPSLSETGRIGATRLETGGVAIDTSRDVMTLPAETAVTPMATPNDPDAIGTGQTPTGYIDPAVLEPEIEARFASARLCRLEIARHKRTAPEQVAAKTLELRWTILPTGAVTGTQVVATAVADPDIMSCVKARMAGWMFTQPRGGPVRMDRTLTFR